MSIDDERRPDLETQPVTPGELLAEVGLSVEDMVGKSAFYIDDGNNTPTVEGSTVLQGNLDYYDETGVMGVEPHSMDYVLTIRNPEMNIDVGDDDGMTLIAEALKALNDTGEMRIHIPPGTIPEQAREDEIDYARALMSIHDRKVTIEYVLGGDTDYVIIKPK